MTKPNKLKWTAAGAGLLVTSLLAPMAAGQSAEALMDALVRKGILTEQEAEDIKADVTKEHKQFNKWQLSSGAISYKLYGDVRGRYEMFRTENDSPGAAAPNKPRDRFRYRLRAGITATLLEDFEAGFRLTSSEPTGTFGGDPISGNSTFQDNGSKKFVYLDLAYGKWTPIKRDDWLLSGTIGKMENPFVVSDMVFDGDYTPEGLALQGGYKFNDVHSLKWNGAYFVLDEINQGSGAGDDPAMIGAQVRWDAKWSPKVASSAGVSWFLVSDEERLVNGAVPNINVGNTRNAAGFTTESFAPIVLDAAVTYTLERAPFNSGAFPVRVGGEFMHNPRADQEENGWWAGVFLGKAGKKGTWELSYRYKHLERDAWYEEFVDSDFGAYYAGGLANSAAGAGYRAGTGVAGHIVKLGYALTDSVTVGATWFYTHLIDEPSRASLAGADPESGQHRVQLDAIWKF